ncbi:MAG: sugar phosphate isomerase/epimerase [Lentisphaerae bacterium]|nr:sugar phosphate isomerase/epimerase [Lentisphaerota bacterium]
MKLGINLVCFGNARQGVYRTQEDVARLCREAGFECVDCHINFTEKPDYLDIAHNLRRQYDAAQVKVHQIHLPLFRFRKDEDGIKLFSENAPRAMECADILGAKFAVAHVDEYRLSPGEEWNFDRVLETTADYFSPVATLGKKYGILPCIENLYEDHLNVPAGCRSRFSAETEDLLALADLFKGDVGICWDFGHAQTAFGSDNLVELRKVSHLLATTHVHDSHSQKDLHLIPFYGNVDWENIMPYLKSINYDGPFSFELLRASFPDALIKETLRYLHTVGTTLLDMAK